MKHMYKIVGLLLLLGASTVHEVIAFNSMPDFVKGSSFVVPFLIDSTKGFNTVNFLAWTGGAQRSGTSAVDVNFSSLTMNSHLGSGGAWVVLNPLQGTLSQISFGYITYDWMGNQLDNKENPPTLGNVSSNPSGFASTSLQIAVGINGTYNYGTVGNLPFPGWGQLSIKGIVFMMNKPSLNPLSTTGFSVPSTIGSNYVATRIPLVKSVLDNDLQIMLMAQNLASSSPNTGCTNTIVCSLDGIQALIATNKVDLTKGVYIVLSNPLPLTVGSSAGTTTYTVYNSVGQQLGSGNMSSYGSIQAPGFAKGTSVVNGMLLFSTSFANNVYALGVSATQNPQVFFLQYTNPSTVTPTGTSVPGTPTVAQLKTQITKLNTDIATNMNLYNADETLSIPRYLSNLITDQYNLNKAQSELIKQLQQA
ncbi:MAG TPA: hypothetical protein VLG50_04395 [Candidatus Saccharimonadales bacterium]|nr:hypothetical protein [Candidatus Saccharimonadales bacterium]